MSSNSLFPISGELLPSDGSAVLVPEFLTESDADDFFAGLHSNTPWEQNYIRLFGKEISEPRLSAWHAEADLPYTYSGVPRTPPPWKAPPSALRPAF